MANTTLTASIIAKAALVILENELGFLKAMYREPEEEFQKSVNGFKIGSSVDLRRPADFTVRSGATLSLQDVIEGKNTLTVDQQKGVDFGFTSSDMTLSVSQLSERVIKPAMSSLVNEIAEDVLGVMYKELYNWAGTPGQTINSFSDFNKGAVRLNEMAVPMEQRFGVLSPDDHGELVSNLTGLFIESDARAAFRKGNLGPMSGIDTFMSQVTPTHTVGVATGTPLVNGADQNVTYDTAKNVWTQTLNTDGWTNSTTGILLEGDVFTIAGVNMVNPKTKADTGILQEFVVRADANSGASTGPAALTISPPIITSGPHQTVNAVPADNAAITVRGSGGTAYKQNLVFHKKCMALTMVPMELPAGAVNPSRQSRNGISVRVIPIYDGTNDKSNWRLDVLYGRKVADPRLGARLSGTS